MTTFGGTAPVSATHNFDALLSTTLFNYKKVMFDNIFKSAAFLALLRKNDGVEMINGGERIARLIMYGKNSTVKSYSGYESLDVTPQDGITTAFYDWREIAGSITISRKEERQNSGEAAIMNLLQQKVMQTEMSLKEKVIDDIIGGTWSGTLCLPGNSSKDLNPLAWFFRKAKATDPTNADVGEIAADTYSWWRHRTASFGANTLTNGDFQISASTRAGLKTCLLKLYNYCVRGGDGSGPNVVLSGQDTYESYELSLDANLRYADQAMADMGFDTIKLKGATYTWDERVPDVYNGYEAGNASATNDTVFMINTKYYKLYIDSETDFTTTPFVSPENQTAKTALVLFMGNTGVTNMRKHGMGCQVSKSITS